MKAKDKKTTNMIVGAMLLVVVAAAAFWIALLSPKKDEAKKLDAQVERLEGSLAQHEAEVSAGEEARGEFSANYHRLVVVGKAVPNEDETASLLVQLNQIGADAGVRFQTLSLEAADSEGEASPAASTGAGGEPVSPTEAAASLMPLGAGVGSAGLAVMPYKLTFTGDFFQVADFIRGLDSLVKTANEEVSVDGRLITINGFTLTEDPEVKFPALEANFSVTTYLSPPSEETAAATSPVGAAEATPAATTTGGAP
jgi:Tfp pilus assembly protein PilO